MIKSWQSASDLNKHDIYGIILFGGLFAVVI